MIAGNNIIALVTFGVLAENYIPEATSVNPSVVTRQILREMLARSSTFQSAIEATGNPAEKIEQAKAHIYLSSYISDALERPFAVISKNESDKHSAIGGGEEQTFIIGGELKLRMERQVPAGLLSAPGSDITKGKEGEAEDDFEEFYEGCIADINALAGKPGYLFIRGWDTIEGPALFESAGAQQKIYGIIKLCRWGIE